MKALICTSCGASRWKEEGNYRRYLIEAQIVKIVHLKNRSGAGFFFESCSPTDKLCDRY